MICPLLMQASLSRENPPHIDDRDEICKCREKDCGFWTGYQCSTVGLVENLGALSMLADTIKGCWR